MCIYMVVTMIITTTIATTVIAYHNYNDHHHHHRRNHFLPGIPDKKSHIGCFWMLSTIDSAHGKASCNDCRGDMLYFSTASSKHFFLAFSERVSL
mmetsp:Transcript_4168/g.11925  ORF Transcript_4168/g.11925 Transcript_4168/m.11925 type:complete len:95 (-) Transcript_4168:300-584(-)